MARRGVSRSQFGDLLYGSTDAALRRKLSRKQYARLRARARKRGLTMEGQVQDVPNPMRERSSSGIRRQAQSTVDAIYRPAEVELSADESRIHALDEKRRYDNENWKTWLTNQTNTLLASGRAADQSIRQSQQKIQMDLDAAWASTQQQARQDAAAATGNVSNPQQSTALDMSAERTKQNELIASERRRTEALSQSGENTRSVAAASNFAYLAGQDARRQADTWSALKDVADNRQKVRLKKAADAATEVARLFDQEITKAQSNREFGAAVQKLGIDASKVAETRRTNRANENIRKRGNQIKYLTLKQNARLKAIDQALARDTLNERKRSNLVKERNALLKQGETKRHNKATEKTGAGRDPGGFTRSEAQGNVNKFESLRDWIKANPELGSTLSLTQQEYDKKLHRLMYSAAREMLQHGGKISKSTQRKLIKRYGFGRRYRTY